MDDLTYELALVYHRLSAAARSVVGQGEHSAGRRSIVRGLYRDGPATSSEMARQRHVSRQHLQKLVSELRRDGLVALDEDPQDARAKLVRLTDQGRRLYEGMVERERTLLEYLANGLDEEDLATAVGVLRAVKARLDDAEWGRLTTESPPAPPTSP
jgi:DNA-binding MarR family transcriptional regulator